MKIGDTIFIHGYIDEIRKDMIIVRNNGGYFGTVPSEIICGEMPERKTGKWTEKHHAYSDEESAIEEWQSCRCSECGRYDTRPYMYYFSEPNYCSYCGADMRGEKHETIL